MRAFKAEVLASQTTIAGVRGMGGIGKTAFALQVALDLASSFPDGQFFLDLGGLPTPISAGDAMTRLIQSIAPGTVVASIDDERAAQLRSLLHGRSVLILLDNSSSSEQILPLIPGPRSLLLFTSRIQFSVPGAITTDLPIMKEHECNSLISAIAPRLQEHASDLATLCGHLPLAMRVSSSTLRERRDLRPQDYLGATG